MAVVPHMEVTHGDDEYVASSAAVGVQGNPYLSQFRIE
jgi:hypothetical protein